MPLCNKPKTISSNEISFRKKDSRKKEKEFSTCQPITLVNESYYIIIDS